MGGNIETKFDSVQQNSKPESMMGTQDLIIPPNNIKKTSELIYDFSIRKNSLTSVRHYLKCHAHPV